MNNRIDKYFTIKATPRTGQPSKGAMNNSSLLLNNSSDITNSWNRIQAFNANTVYGRAATVKKYHENINSHDCLDVSMQNEYFQIKQQMQQNKMGLLKLSNNNQLNIKLEQDSQSNIKSYVSQQDYEQHSTIQNKGLFKANTTSNSYKPIEYRPYSNSSDAKYVVEDNEENINKIINKDRKTTVVATAALVNAMGLIKSYPKLDCLYEIYGSCVNIRLGKYWCEKIIILRDHTGPVMQVSVFEVDKDLEEDILPGDALKAIGKMVSYNHLKAFKVRKAKPEEMQTVSRLYGVSLYHIKKM